jgi:hypothetical protein
MNDGGAGACRATHVKFISLPLLMCNSELPKIFAFETEKNKKKAKKSRKKGARNLMLMNGNYS